MRPNKATLFTTLSLATFGVEAAPAGAAEHLPISEQAAHTRVANIPLNLLLETGQGRLSYAAGQTATDPQAEALLIKNRQCNDQALNLLQPNTATIRLRRGAKPHETLKTKVGVLDPACKDLGEASIGATTKGHRKGSTHTLFRTSERTVKVSRGERTYSLRIPVPRSVNKGAVVYEGHLRTHWTPNTTLQHLGAAASSRSVREPVVGTEGGSTSTTVGGHPESYMEAHCSRKLPFANGGGTYRANGDGMHITVEHVGDPNDPDNFKAVYTVTTDDEVKLFAGIAVDTVQGKEFYPVMKVIGSNTYQWVDEDAAKPNAASGIVACGD